MLTKFKPPDLFVRIELVNMNLFLTLTGGTFFDPFPPWCNIVIVSRKPD